MVTARKGETEESMGPAPAIEPESLPVFRLASGEAVGGPDPALLWSMTAGGGGQDARESKGRVRYERGSLALEYFPASGSVWFADESRLWPTAQDEGAHSPPDANRARISAESQLRSMKLGPFAAGDDPHSEQVFAGIRSTVVVHQPREGLRREPRQIDAQAAYATRVRLPESGGSGSRTLPVVGGGCKTSVVLDLAGTPIGFWSFRRKIEGVEGAVKVVPAREARARFEEGVRKRFGPGRVEVEKYDSVLAYDAAPPGVEQMFLTPVRLHSATLRMGERRVTHRTVVTPATDEPLGNPIRADFVCRPPLRAADVTDPPAGGTWSIPLSGSMCSERDVGGFAASLRKAGWAMPHEHLDAQVVLDHFKDRRAEFVEEVDLAFYCGHATWEGWDVHPPGYAGYDVLEPLGTGRLKWLVIGGCGPLEDPCLLPALVSAAPRGSETAVARWQGLFGGLRSLMGYASGSVCSELEGAIFADEALAGTPLRAAWFKAACHTQPVTDPVYGLPVYAAALFPDDGVEHPELDLLPTRAEYGRIPPPHRGYRLICQPM